MTKHTIEIGEEIMTLAVELLSACREP